MIRKDVSSSVDLTNLALLLCEPFAGWESGFLAEGFGEVGEALVSAVEGGFGDIEAAACEGFAGAFDAEAAEVALEGETGLGGDFA